MRIITGKLKGRQLETPLDNAIRPTADRCKESMFNIIEVRKGLIDAVALDLFAGTGNLGFEAISRGARHVTSVDASPESARIIKAGAKHFEVENQIQFVAAEVGAYLDKGPAAKYDLIFADPPYDWAGIPSLPDRILNEGWLKDDGWLLLEHDARHNFVNHPRCVFAKPYGRTIVSIFPMDGPTEEP